MPPRLKDIAEDLGVSVVTVSKVLRNHSDIGAETRQRVLKRIKELNYRPNLAARALVTGRSYGIGFVVPDLIHPFFGQVAKGITKVLREKNYNLMISSSEDDPALERAEIEQLLSRRVDALIVASAHETPESLRRIEDQKVPYVIIDRKLDGLRANYIGVDDEQVGFMATSHLIEQGCLRVAHIRGADVSTGQGRMRGYQRALQEAGHPLRPEYVEFGKQGSMEADERGYQVMRELLKLPLRPDGVFCFNDQTASGAMQAILEAGLRIPQDIAVVGCGNVRYSHMLRVPLTSVDQDSVGMGEQAARMALRLIEGPVPDEPENILIKPRLVPRASSLRLG